MSNRSRSGSRARSFCGVGAIIALLGAAICDAARAQEPSSRPPAGAKPRAPLPAGGTIVGIALDTAGIPIDSVEIRIASLQRRTFSDGNGAFRFDDVKPGTYDVAARRIGFAPQVRRVTVAIDRGGSATFALVPMRYVLPPVVTSSRRGGLGGVIGDTAFNVIRGAEVYVVGSGRRTRTDSAGTFFLDVEPGSYMVQVTRPGFARKLLSVTIPKDSGRHVTVWMSPSKGRADAREAWAIEGFRDRVLRRRATDKFYTREELSRYRFTWLRQFVVMSAGVPVADDCDAVVDGLWRRPIYSLTLDEVESVEVYPPGRPRPPRSIDSRGAAQVSSGSSCPTVFVWTRD